ncbi:MAG: prepilin-type N-terminal cleavage/methylation domain-containing protein [Gammaproteobacteria bacterium]|nr:prepilin-type N-terminal cleavage/methylation domain-containing protein [Gammaproteobacteria bacterium]
MGTDSRGFTLLELVIVIVILGLTMAFAAPGLSTMIKNNRVSGNANDFVAALQFAKAEAASRINPVTLCKKNSAGTACVGGGDWQQGDWQQGWIVFSDLNGDAAVDGDDTVLLNHETLDAKITFGGTAGVATAVTYWPSGTTSVTGTEVLIICDDRGFADSAKGILVTITGRGAVMKASETGQIACL